tara:strand:- start:279 stop:650 length:372 start_codon:yes stop_codon:yes gene_type:complete
MLQHKHLLVRATVDNPPTDRRYMKKWIRKLISKIKMKMLGQPIIKYVETTGNRGLTAVACIETSHIAFHSWDETSPGLVQLDVYTCSELDEQTVFDWMTPFAPKEIKWKYYDRENNLQLVKEA